MNLRALHAENKIKISTELYFSSNVSFVILCLCKTKYSA